MQLLISVFLLQSVLHNIKYKCVKVPFGWHRFSLSFIFLSLFLFFFLSFFLSFFFSLSLSQVWESNGIAVVWCLHLLLFSLHLFNYPSLLFSSSSSLIFVSNSGHLHSNIPPSFNLLFIYLFIYSFFLSSFSSRFLFISIFLLLSWYSPFSALH